MKKIVYLLSLIFLGGCFAKPKPAIPAFNLMMLDSLTIFNTQKIPEGKPTMLVWFSPDCEHCQKETGDLLKKMDSLKSVNFYFITIEPIDRMRLFNDYFKIYKYPNITLGRDYTFSFPKHYKNMGVPYSMIFDQDKVLRAVFKGEAPADKVVQIINTLN